MASSNPLISIIIPVHNVENLIPVCLTSIINQTYLNLEIIVIDDGSTDSSYEICQQFAMKDSRIHLIHQENQGVSCARNAGLDIANGEYISFVDSDDYIHPQMIEILYQTLIENNADISMCNYTDVFEGNVPTVLELPKSKEIENMSGYEGIGKLLHRYYVPYVVPWNKLYKRTLFSNIRFPVGLTHEDEYVMQEIFLHAKKISYLKNPLYFYLQRNSSITHTETIEDKAIMLQILKHRTDFCIEHNIYKGLSTYWYLSRYQDYIWGYQTKYPENKTVVKCLMHERHSETLNYFKYLDLKNLIKLLIRVSPLWNYFMNR